MDNHEQAKYRDASGGAWIEDAGSINNELKHL